MLAKQARKIQAPECGANMLLLAARRTVVGSASVMLPSSFSGPDMGACSAVAAGGAAGVRYS